MSSWYSELLPPEKAERRKQIKDRLSKTNEHVEAIRLLRELQHIDKEVSK